MAELSDALGARDVALSQLAAADAAVAELKVGILKVTAAFLVFYSDDNASN